MEPKNYTSRECIHEIGKYLKQHSIKKDSLFETAYDNGVPIFCPAFTDSSAGFGLVIHQENNPEKCVKIAHSPIAALDFPGFGLGFYTIGVPPCR